MDWVGEFFRTLPQAFSALWAFGEGWYGIAVTIGSIVLTVLFALLAQRLRETYGWLSAIFGMMAATIALYWFYGILPSAWIYFADGQRDLLEDTVIPGTLGFGRYVIAANFYQVFRDLIVVIEQGVALVATTVIALRLQKRYPRALAEGEEARPQSGGYK